MLKDVHRSSKAIFVLEKRTVQVGLVWLAGLFLFSAFSGFLLSSSGPLLPDGLRRYSLQLFLAIALVYVYFAAGWRPVFGVSKRMWMGAGVVILGFLGGLKVVDFLLEMIGGPSLGGKRYFGGTEQLLLGVLIAPILEELFFRDLIFRALYSKWATLTVPILFSSAFFMMAHMALYPGAFLLGILSAWIFYFSESIIPSMLLHSISNLSWFFLPVFYPHLFRQLMEWKMLNYFYR